MGLISNSTTIFDAGAIASGLGSSMTVIKKLTASSSGTLSFVNGSNGVVLDSTYKEYVFVFNNIHASAGSDSTYFAFQASTDTGSNYNTTLTSTYVATYNNEADNLQRAPTYRQQSDFAKPSGTDFQRIAYQQDDGNQIGAGGILHLYNPSGTTHVKHFMSRSQTEGYTDYAFGGYVAGYFNTTSALDAVQFKFNSGNIDAGTITLYGIS